MEGSSTNEEAKVTERTTTFCLYHPCYLLEEVLGALFKCLGFEIGVKGKEHESSVVKPPSDSEGNPITAENCSTKEHESSTTSAEEQECSTTRSFEFITNLTIRSGPRTSVLTSGSSPETN